jgi:hypothetical protein
MEPTPDQWPGERPPSDGPPTVTALLDDGPLAESQIETEVVEGRPPKTLDVDDPDGGTCRYVLSEWVQEGPTARYSYLYRVGP